MVMVSNASGEWKSMPASIAIYVENVHATYQRALEVGAISLREPTDQFYGDRSAGVKDLAGNHWWIATHLENVPPEELRLRAEQWMKEEPTCGNDCASCEELRLRAEQWMKERTHVQVYAPPGEEKRS